MREFAAYTADLYRLADWLTACGIRTVAMESTGVYWIPLFQVLEERRVKNVSGRKSDVADCQWLQQLHTYGLLTSAFRPDDETCVLRSYMRQRDSLVIQAGQHIQHMQKALEFADIGQEAYERHYQARRRAGLQRTAKQFGFQLVPAQSP